MAKATPPATGGHNTVIIEASDIDTLLVNWQRLGVVAITGHPGSSMKLQVCKL